MNIRFFAGQALAGALLLTSASHASAQQVASTDPKTAPAGTYVVEPYHTQVGFSISHLGFTNYAGVFSQVSGSLALDPAHPGHSRLEVTIPIASVQTTSTKLDGELKSDQWFDAEKFPNATFTSTSVVPTSTRSATVTGDFTLHGVTKPVALKVRFIGTGINPLDKAQTVGFEATGVIRRSDFGVKQYVPLVGDDVALVIAGAFELKK